MALSRWTLLPAIGLVCAAGLAWTPEGTSFVDLLLEQFGYGVLPGLLMLFGFGSPFVFALCIVICVVALPPKTARRVVRIPIALMHSQLVLVALALFFAGDVVAPYALLGFALVGGLRLAFHTATANTQGDGPSLRWYTRWGATVIAGVAMWMELQRTGGISFGNGLHVALGCALLLVVFAGRRSER